MAKTFHLSARRKPFLCLAETLEKVDVISRPLEAAMSAEVHCNHLFFSKGEMVFFEDHALHAGNGWAFNCSGRGAECETLWTAAIRLNKTTLPMVQ